MAFVSGGLYIVKTFSVIWLYPAAENKNEVAPQSLVPNDVVVALDAVFEGIGDTASPSELLVLSKKGKGWVSFLRLREVK